jgi:hypothetical protein
MGGGDKGAKTWFSLELQMRSAMATGPPAEGGYSEGAVYASRGFLGSDNAYGKPAERVGKIFAAGPRMG